MEHLFYHLQTRKKQLPLPNMSPPNNPVLLCSWCSSGWFLIKSPLTAHPAWGWGKLCGHDMMDYGSEIATESIRGLPQLPRQTCRKNMQDMCFMFSSYACLNPEGCASFCTTRPNTWDPYEVASKNTHLMFIQYGGYVTVVKRSWWVQLLPSAPSPSPPLSPPPPPISIPSLCFLVPKISQMSLTNCIS